MWSLTPRQFWRFWWRYLAGVAMWMALGYFGWNAVAAWSAHAGHGRTGNWTVTRISCTKNGCFPVAVFTSDDGSDVRPGVQMRGAPSGLRVGSTLRAIDSGGDEVFPSGGGDSYIKLTVASAIDGVICIIWIWTVPAMAFKRWRGRRAHDPNQMSEYASSSS